MIVEHEDTISDWEQKEIEALLLFDFVFIEDKPKEVQDYGMGLVVRLAFGQKGMTEKLLCADNMIDDRVVELMKWELCQNESIFKITPTQAPLLTSIDNNRLKFTGQAPDGKTKTISLPITKEFEDYEKELPASVIEKIILPPFVDCRKMLNN